MSSNIYSKGSPTLRYSEIVHLHANANWESINFSHFSFEKILLIRGAFLREVVFDPVYI